MRETFVIRVGYPVGEHEVPFVFRYSIGTLVLAYLVASYVANDSEPLFLLSRFAGLYFADFYNA